MDAFRNNVELGGLASIGLVRGQVARIEHARGSLVRVEQGRVWLTEGGMPDDVCLAAGEFYRIAGNGLTLLATHRRCSFAFVTLDPALAPRPNLAQRLADAFWHGWAGLYVHPSRPSASGL
jgi:hypothetical protein